MHAMIKAGGIYHILLVIFHLSFWYIFNWGEDLLSLSFLNRQIMQVLNLCLTFAFVIFGYISLVHTKELLSTSLGKSLLGFIALFWLLRGIEQAVFFTLGHWASVAFLLFFLVGMMLYAVPALSSYKTR